MNFLVLAAGSAPLDPQNGSYPLCLSELDGVPMIEKIITTCHTVANARVIVALREEEARLYHLDNIVRLSAGIEDPADLLADLDQALTSN